MMNRNILVVDDEELQANIIANILEKEGYRVWKAYSAEEALKIIINEDIGVVLIDMKMPGMGGMGFIKKTKGMGIKSKIIMMTAYGTIETAVEAMKNGAYDYITKPFSKEELLVNIENAVDAFNLEVENRHLKEELRNIYEDYKLIGISSAIEEIRNMIVRVASNDSSNVLITGESGTGKELVAREIHSKSSRAKMPFVAVNCSAIPENLLESELFGYEKGAFTGAYTKREGKFKAANGGTIFFDEIGDMPINMQAKLLRVIQDREVTPIGGNSSYKVDVRIISATNKDLEELVKRGEFRDDLYYRLNVVPIHIPPLRERKEDIPVLVKYIIEKLNRKMNKNIKGISEDILSMLLSYGFPGNVRELENILERAFILAGRGPLKKEHFPMLMHSANKSIKENFEIDTDIGREGFNLKEISKRARDYAEKRAIEEALVKTGWNRLKAAKLLNIDYKTLRTKIKELGIKP